MTTINLPTDPNSSFPFREGEHSFRITIRSFGGMTLVSISDLNGPIYNGCRAICGQWLIPYKHLALNGNFRFESDTSEEYPYYTGFNSDFRLVYYTNEEVEKIGW